MLSHSISFFLKKEPDSNSFFKYLCTNLWLNMSLKKSVDQIRAY